VVSGPGVNRYGSPLAGAAHVTVEELAAFTAGERSITLSMVGISDIAVSVAHTVQKRAASVKSI
jgi:hypothetical protein